MDTIEKDKEALIAFITEFKAKYESMLDEEITDWETIKEIISFFIDGYPNNKILDFIDLGSWDSIESYQFHDENRKLELIWHNYLESDDEMTILAMGAHVLKCDVLISSIILSSNKSLPVLLIRGFYQDPKSIQRAYNQGCSQMQKFSCHPFSTEVVKTVKNKIHSITIPNIHCYTMSLFPNYLGNISVADSKRFLFDKNIKLASLKITKLMDDLVRVEDGDVERIQQIGNSTRINFENGLKVLLLKAHTDLSEEINIQLNGDYQKAMLGDLVRVIRNTDVSEAIGLNTAQVVDILNKCSHDAGIPISKVEVHKAQIFVIASLNFN
ncbi:hypothetical protein FXE80_15470 [Vibrio cholerae]|uniref:hypothetical protein n=1 Tax=Vibrio cholerae TaxID=666 RepID=UPI0011D67699|nr:hypothetical protein [Vibrio cholerae]TXY71269.1 hypothetical protein FXE80_15470 [Vibrio cholerae]GIB20875.1 hypothetical protein VCSRO90_3878 [Vibrio cholerae]